MNLCAFTCDYRWCSRHDSEREIDCRTLVRPDGNNLKSPSSRFAEGVLAGCVELAGESPALAIAGDPGSRLPASSEISPLKRSVKSTSMTVRLSGGERSRGPSHKRTLQPRDIGPRKGGDGRADHFTAKATDCICNSGWMQDTPGVWRRARDESSTRNRRGPHRREIVGDGEVVCDERLGGILKHYRRAA